MPSFIPYPAQDYLRPAPAGIGLAFARNKPGGDGRGTVQFIVIEQGWITEHEAWQVKSDPDSGWNWPEAADHGAASLGVILMQKNPSGATGIAPEVRGTVLSPWREKDRFDLAETIRLAIRKLQPGDVLLLEVQTVDPRFPAICWPSEIEAPVFAAIREATDRGIIVVEPSGNGDRQSGQGQDLGLYRNPLGRMPFRSEPVSDQDSGAILVAAATDGSPQERLPASNFGQRVDCYACGDHVFTTGSFPGLSLPGTNGYTRHFGGSSAASAIIAGVVILIQTITEAATGKKWNARQMRQMLSDPLLGTGSQNGNLDKIGTMPDLKKIIGYLDGQIFPCLRESGNHPILQLS